MEVASVILRKMLEWYIKSFKISDISKLLNLFQTCIQMSSIDFCKIISIENESSCINTCHRERMIRNVKHSTASNLKLTFENPQSIFLESKYFLNISNEIWKNYFLQKTIYEIGKCQLGRTLIIFCCK